MSKRYSDTRYLRFIISIALALGFFNLAWAAPPGIDSITPDIGSNNEPTPVTMHGSGFQPTSKVALYGGDACITGSCDTPDSARDVCVAGAYAYVAAWKSGLQVIDVSDPKNPRIVGACDTPGSARGVYITGTYAYVADENSGLHVIEKFSPLPDIQYIDSNTLTATVPSGYRPGNLHITNPDGGHAVLHNAFGVGINMELPAGWSMISLPVVPQDAHLSTLFPEEEVVYRYQKGTGYVRVQTGENLEVGVGYWILFDEPESYLIMGTEITTYTMAIADGWYMISGCTSPAQTTVTSGKVDVIYRYSPGVGYERLLASEPLEPGREYWILFRNTSEGGEFTARTPVSE